jgi:hypothetical protein
MPGLVVRKSETICQKVDGVTLEDPVRLLAHHFQRA